MRTASVAVSIGAWAILAVEGEFGIVALRPAIDVLYAVFLMGLGGMVVGWTMHRWGTARVGRILARITTVGVSLAVASVAAESAARFLTRDVKSAGDARTYLAHRAPGRRHNELGFREREIGPKQKYRIVVVGDSFTEGQGITEEERFSNLMEEALGPDYEVLNFGRSGNDMPQHQQVLEEALPVLPDFVLLQLFINDFEVDGMKRADWLPLVPWPSVDSALLSSSVLYSLLSQEWLQFQVNTGMVETYAHYMERNLGDPNAPASRHAFALLQRFIDRARGGGVPVGIVLFPNPEALGPTYPFGYLHDRVRALCVQDDVQLVDLRPVLAPKFPKPDAMWVNRFDHHPNARVNRVAAAAILDNFVHVWQRRVEP